MMSLDVDEVLERIGPLGKFQIRTVIILAWMEFCAAIFILAPTFQAGEPPWECVQNTSCDMTGQFSKGMTDYGKRCSMERHEWRFVNTYTSVITEWDLVCANGLHGPLAKSLYFGGFLVGVLVVGYLSDRFGRRKTGYIAAVFRSIVGFSAAFSPSIWFFNITRICIGASAGGLVFFVLAVEISGVKHRGTAGTIVWLGFVTSIMAVAPLAYLFRDWRDLSLAMGIISLTVIPLWWWIPESPQWLVVNGRMKEAEELLRNMAKLNNKEYPEEGLKSAAPPENITRKQNFFDLFKTRQNCYKICVQWIAWAVISLVYYCVAFGTSNIGGDMYLTYFLLCLVELPSNFCTMWAIIKIGRKYTTIGCMVCAAAASIVAVLLPFNTSMGYTVGRIIVAIIAKFMVSTSYNSIYVWSGELMPTVVRNVGVGSCSSAARIGSFSAPYVNYLQGFHPMVPFAVMAVLSIVVSGLLWFLPETRGQQTQENINTGHVRDDEEKMVDKTDKNTIKDMNEMGEINLAQDTKL